MDLIKNIKDLIIGDRSSTELVSVESLLLVLLLSSLIDVASCASAFNGSRLLFFAANFKWGSRVTGSKTGFIVFLLAAHSWNFKHKSFDENELLMFVSRDADFDFVALLNISGHKTDLEQVWVVIEILPRILTPNECEIELRKVEVRDKWLKITKKVAQVELWFSSSSPRESSLKFRNFNSTLKILRGTPNLFFSSVQSRDIIGLQIAVLIEPWKWKLRSRREHK